MKYEEILKKIEDFARLQSPTYGDLWRIFFTVVAWRIFQLPEQDRVGLDHSIGLFFLMQAADCTDGAIFFGGDLKEALEEFLPKLRLHQLPSEEHERFRKKVLYKISTTFHARSPLPKPLVDYIPMLRDISDSGNAI